MSIGHTHHVGTLAATTPDRFVLLALIAIGLLAAFGAAAGMFAAVRSRRNHELAALALCDGLTGVANRRRLDRDLVVGVADADTPVAVIMIDIDHFKLVNDEHGREAGDDALRQVADVIRGAVRVGDVVYRYGGAEFCVLLAHTTTAEAGEVAERIRFAVSRMALAFGATLTVSIGVALGKGAHVTQTMTRADTALLKSKDDGRDRVTLAAQPLLGPMAVTPTP
jgi:diguanylate cyclase (GGDEF)-like protein